jgi:hypothetical protein
MAKQPSKRNQERLQSFLTLLATDPNKLLAFIKDPESVLEEHNFKDPTTKALIRNMLALEVAKKMAVWPVAAYIHW